MLNGKRDFMARHQEGNQFGTAITFLLIGAGAGAVAALLLAPKSGEQLRRDLRRRYEDAREAIEDLADEAKGRVEDAIERGSDWMEDVEETTRKRVAPLARALRRD
jgi:gas vesicle protein